MQDEAFLEYLNAHREGFPFRLPTRRESEHIANGDFHLGTIGLRGASLSIDLQRTLPLGLSLVAGTGQGKTSLLTLLARAISKLEVGCWLFNVRPEPNDALPGFTKVRATDIPVAVLEYRPDLRAEVQAARVADTIASAFYLLWSRTAITTILTDFYKKGVSPTLTELRDELAKLRSGKSSGMQPNQITKLVGVFQHLVQVFGDSATTRSGFRPPEHANDKLIIELDVADGQVHALLITRMLEWLYSHNVAHNLRNKLRTVILVDESRYLLDLDRERQSADFGSPVLDQIICEQRSAGLALVAATQTGFPKAYSTNTASKFLFRTGDARYFSLAAQSMGLSREQIEYGKHLQVGEAIVTTPKHPEPLVVRLREPQFEPEAEEIKSDRKTGLLDKILRYAKLDGQRAEEPVQQLKLDIQAQERQLVPGADELLCFGSGSPMSPVTEIYKTLKLTPRQGTKAKEHLLANNLAIAERVRLFAGKGGQVLLLESTKKGREHLSVRFPAMKNAVKCMAGKGSLEHRVHAELVRDHFQARGYLTKVESREADVAIQRPGQQEWTAIEIANKNSRNLESRVQANRNAGAERTIVVCSDAATAKRLQKQFESEGDVEVHEVDRYLRSRETETQGSQLSLVEDGRV